MKSGNALKIERKKARLSQYKLCWLAEVSRFRYGLAEQGYLTLTVEEQFRIDQTLRKGARK